MKKNECIKKVFLNNYLFHITPERMDGRKCTVEKSSNIKEWMVQVDLPKEANGEKNLWPVATHLFKYSDTLP